MQNHPLPFVPVRQAYLQSFQYFVACYPHLFPNIRQYFRNTDIPSLGEASLERGLVIDIIKTFSIRM
jgi:hypothetical protein